MNSAALAIHSKEALEKEGYGKYLTMFSEEINRSAAAFVFLINFRICLFLQGGRS